MPGQKISTLTPVASLQPTDQFVLARSGSTYKISGDKFIPKPASASAQQVLTYNSSTSTWVASALPAGNSGTVTSVTGNLPISVANGTTTPAISIAAATTSAAGTMSSTDKTRLDDASTVNGIVKSDGSGNFSAAVAGTDYLTSSDLPGTGTQGNGYQVLPGDLIVQWGITQSVGDDTHGSFTFPFAFPTACHSVVMTCSQPTAGCSYFAVTSKTNTGFGFYHSYTDGFQAADAGYYLALGY